MWLYFLSHLTDSCGGKGYKWSHHRTGGPVPKPKPNPPNNALPTISYISWIVELYWLQIQNFMLICDTLLCPMDVYEMFIPFIKDK